MRCETCQGMGRIPADSPPFGVILWPCPDCIGGAAHCCEGLTVQPCSEREEVGNAEDHQSLSEKLRRRPPGAE